MPPLGLQLPLPPPDPKSAGLRTFGGSSAPSNLLAGKMYPSGNLGSLYLTQITLLLWMGFRADTGELNVPCISIQSLDHNTFPVIPSYNPPSRLISESRSISSSQIALTKLNPLCPSLTKIISKDLPPPPPSSSTLPLSSRLPTSY